MPTTSSTTIGVAVPVPEPYGSVLRAARASFGDPMAATVPAHITLAPPAQVQERDLERLAIDLERVAALLPPYQIRLRGTGTFRPVSPVVFVAVSEGISDTEVLARQVCRVLGDEVSEFPYHPHVTVAHHLDDPTLDRAYDELAGFECRFRVAEFALYHHDDVQGWVPQQTFALRKT